jgi:predicted secreted acid phosphatase
MKSTGTIFSIIYTSLICSSLALSFPCQPGIACPCSEVKVPASQGKEFTISEGLSYMNTGAYRQEFEKAVGSARKACEKHRGEKHLAIVSDIDETVLSNAEYLKAHPDGGWGDFDSAWVSQSRAPALKPPAGFLAWARKNGFAVFFITGRPEHDRRDTIANLINAGIAYDGLFLRPEGDNSPAEEMKVKYRKQIESLGFKIIVNMGDQYSDLVGGHAEDCEKLPNKMYLVP